MKLLYFTDTHIRGIAPINRKDDFLFAMKEKFQEIKELIVQEKIDFCLHGGDFFDRPDIAPAIVRQFGALLQDYQVPIYVIAGNHDIYGHNPDTVSRTMLGLLAGLHIVQMIQSGEKIWLEKDGVSVQLTGQSFVYNLDQQDRAGYVVQKEAGVNYAVHLVHGMLVEKPFFGDYTLLDQIARTEADFTLAGHYHHGFSKPIEIEGRSFINPGSLARLENSLAERQRKPQVVILELQPQASRVRFVPLQCAKPGDQVLNEKGLSLKDYSEKKMAEFLQGIKVGGEFQAFDLQGVMHLLSERDNIAAIVKEQALLRIAAAQEVLLHKEEQE